MSSCRRVVLVLVAAAVVLAARALPAAEQVAVFVDSDAPALERRAALELGGQLQQLFEVDVAYPDRLPAAHQRLILVGSPQTNPAVARLAGETWPEISDQGLVLRSFDDGARRGLVVGGGSPVATLWAVYELGHRWGIRYLLREDIYPDAKPLALGPFDVVMEPALRTRTWRTINDFAIGPESWSVTDHRRLLAQLAKLKFNRIMLSVYPWQPFVHYEAEGVQKQTATLWFGEKYRIEPDSPGRVAFGAADEFTNADFAGAESYEAMTAAGIRHARGIARAAGELGMSVGISISPLEFPREFAALPGMEPARGLHNLTVAPGGKLPPDDPRLARLVKAKIRAYLETYPDIDTLYLTLPEFPQWDQHSEAAWQQLAAAIGSDAPQLSQLVEAARQRSLTAAGDRGERAIKGNIVTLAFLRQLLSDSQLLRRGDGTQVEVVLSDVDPALFPHFEHVLPKDAATLNFVDYTARRVAQHRELLAQVPADKVPSRLILTLADDNVGILSQSAHGGLQTLVQQIHKLGWDGFSTRYWMLAELDPSVYFLSRAAWQPELTARQAHDDLFVTICGKQSVADRLWMGFEHIRQATELTDEHDLGFAFPVAGMMIKHYQDQPPPAWWEQQAEHYTQAMIELYRSRDAAHPRAQPRLFYYAKRSEYVLDYLNCVKAVRAAAIAKAAGDREEAITQLETAVEALYNAIDTLSDVAEDPSDRGLIAVLNTHAFGPLMSEYEKLLEAP